MSSPAKFFLTLLVLALAALGGFLLLQQEQAPIVVPPDEPPAVQPEQPTGPVDPLAAKGATQEPRPVEPARTEVAPDTRSSAPQGFRGRIVDPNSQPMAGVEVYMMPGVGTNIFEMMMMSSKGVTLPPVAAGKTDNYGVFELGVPQGGDQKVYEFRAVTEQYVEHTMPNLRVKQNEWYDLGTIRLEIGAQLFGRVTVAGSNGLGIADAEVRIRAANALSPVTPTPGRELGIVVKTDPNGHYRATNVAASFNVVTVGAVAPGFAISEVQNVTVQGKEPKELNLELSPGMEMAGVVVDAAGMPVAGARLRGIAISSKTPATLEARSGRDGKFQMLGLTEGPYVLQTNAAGFVQSELKPVQAGDKDVQVTLEKQGEAKIQVFSRSGRVMTSGYTLELKAYHDGDNGQSSIGQTLQTVQARPDQDGTTTVSGIDPGATYVFLVQAAGHAMAFSDPFRVEIGLEPPLLIVRLDEGGVLEGVVTQPDGSPIQGVAVSTISNEFDPNPFTDIFGAMIPVKITRKSVQTDAKGRFRIDLLNSGSYQLKFQHPEFIETFRKDNVVASGQTTTVTPVVLAPGTIISGSVTVAGAPAGQIKVTISTKMDQAPAAAPLTPGKGPSAFFAEAFTDAQGKFQLTKKVPPGIYEMTASRQVHPDGPFGSLIDVMKSKTQVEVFAAQATRQVTFALQ